MKRVFTSHTQMWVARCFLIVCILVLGLPSTARTAPLSLNSQSAIDGLQSASPRTVNIPYLPEDFSWTESAIFWFGLNEQGAPSRNYVDIRMAYTAQALHIRATVVDYYLWYDENPKPSDDLTQYDAISIYLNTNHDQAGAPQSDDYTFLIGARHWQDMAAYLRQARGTGSGWNSTWTAAWSGESAMQWNCNPGPNSNTCGIDYGWWAAYTIPWTALGLSGPPSEGTMWGLGVQLYDRDDQPPAGYVAPEYWPETFNANGPASWGKLHFGYASYTPALAEVSGSTVIRASSVTDNTVEDSWMGGGGTCSGGHEGGSEINHGDSSDLFVGSEIQPTHFPCFNKSFLRFSLNSIPPGKEIISATLTLHLWGNAGAPGQAQPSWVSLFTITDPWSEMAINWNNAPLAQENISASWVNPVLEFPGWPGVPYSWNATQAVAEAYAQDIPASLAIYSSDSDQHSSKYLTSSETGDWNVESRPTLKVMWGEPLAKVSKQVEPSWVTHGATVTYSLNWLGIGQPLTLTDDLPAGLSDPGTLVASSGTVNYNPGTRQITWSGTPVTGQVVTITYTVTVQVSGPLLLANTATLSSSGESGSSTATLCIDCKIVNMPIFVK
jgi:hypothetical protein